MCGGSAGAPAQLLAQQAGQHWNDTIHQVDCVGGWMDGEVGRGTRGALRCDEASPCEGGQAPTSSSHPHKQQPLAPLSAKPSPAAAHQTCCAAAPRGPARCRGPRNAKRRRCAHPRGTLRREAPPLQAKAGRAARAGRGSMSGERRAAGQLQAAAAAAPTSGPVWPPSVALLAQQPHTQRRQRSAAQRGAHPTAHHPSPGRWEGQC